MGWTDREIHTTEEDTNVYRALILTFLASTAGAAEPDPAKLEYFEKKVRPILVGHCYACHSADTKPAGGLRVDDRNGIITGGNGGKAIVPGKSAESLLLKRVAKDAKKRMPAEGEHLTDEQIAILSKWIDEGAVWPPVKLPSSFGKQKEKYEELKREHWAFQPRRIRKRRRWPTRAGRWTTSTASSSRSSNRRS